MEHFQGGTFTPEASINSPVATRQRQAYTDKDTDRADHKQGHTTKTIERMIHRDRRELNSSVNLLRTSCSLPTYSLRVLVDRAVLLLLPAKEKIP